MLLKLREVIKQEKLVNIQHLARLFSMDEQALEPMLAIWVGKGVIKRLDAAAGGCRGGCVRCAPVYYQWLS